LFATGLFLLQHQRFPYSVTLGYNNKQISQNQGLRIPLILLFSRKALYSGYGARQATDSTFCCAADVLSADRGADSGAALPGADPSNCTASTSEDRAGENLQYFSSGPVIARLPCAINFFLVSPAPSAGWFNLESEHRFGPVEQQRELWRN
jgi:hypothetical protein